MSEQNKFSIAHNFKLIMEQVKLFPRATLIIMLIVTLLLGVWGAGSSYSVPLLAYGLIMNLFGMILLKCMILFSRYRYFYGIAYPGSILVTSALLSIAVFFLLLRPEMLMQNSADQMLSQFGPFGMRLVMSGMFLFVFAANLATSNWWHRKKPGIRAFRRQLGLEDPSET